MDTASLNLPDPADVARTLQATLGEMPQPLFAVLDGALFDDLPGDLLSAGFSCRSLFLEHGDKEVERAGPWLFALDNERARAHAEALALAQPCAVFWSCPEGEMALWRHLRTLNEVMIPVEGSAREEADQPAQYERVMFRHWDPNVIAAVMPVLDAEQFARMFGPSTYIFINAPDYGGLKRIPKPDSLPPAPPGPLRLTPDQIGDLKRAMVHSSRLRIGRFLRRTASEETKQFDDRQLLEVVDQYNRQARALGVDEERAQTRFAWLMLCSKGQFILSPGVKAYLGSGDGTPSSRVHRLTEAMAVSAVKEIG
jgi:hypothetical protein